MRKMDNEKTINEAVKLYFQGGNWQRFLKEEARNKESFKEILKNIIKEEQ